MKKDKLLDVMSLYFRTLAGGYCQKCNKFFGIYRLQLCHGVGRWKLATRYEQDNLAVLCAGCHREIDQNMFAKTELFFKLVGAERYEALRVQSEKIKVKIDKEALLDYYKGRLQEIEGG